MLLAQHHITLLSLSFFTSFYVEVAISSNHLPLGKFQHDDAVGGHQTYNLIPRRQCMILMLPQVPHSVGSIGF